MKRIISDLPHDRYRERTVLVRVDFNVPLDHGRFVRTTAFGKPSRRFEYLSQRGAKVILASHLGKPKGKVVPALSLKPVADRLGQILRVSTVKFVEAAVGESVKQALTTLKPGGSAARESAVRTGRGGK